MIIVGSGLAGTLIASNLNRKGIVTTTLEKSKNHGRLATRYCRYTADIGAQFFTVRTSLFQSVVDEWIQKDLARLWTHGFPPKYDKHPRYYARNGMRNLVSYLAKGLNIKFETQVNEIIELQDEFILKTNNSEYRSNVLILALPVPQAIRLLEQVSIPKNDIDLLKQVEYYPCITLLFESDEHISDCGAYQYKGEVIDYICNNKTKGISSSNIVTLHCTSLFSELHFSSPKKLILEMVQKELSQFTKITIEGAKFKMWKYAQPKNPFDFKSYSLPLGNSKHIIFGGDQFANSKIEGTFLSAMEIVDKFGSKEF
eukprot:NODE_130_length_18488_cov_0.389961.p5 type:complete len:313 gc:universal NODE_130_length_18488_cov_0.389961:4151-3213(-)